jgi:hypothetical protein
MASFLLLTFSTKDESYMVHRIVLHYRGERIVSLQQTAVRDLILPNVHGITIYNNFSSVLNNT